MSAPFPQSVNKCASTILNLLICALSLHKYMFYKPACAGSCPDPPPHRRVTFPALMTSSTSLRTTTRCPCRTCSPGFTSTKPSRASSTHPSAVLISFLEDMVKVEKVQRKCWLSDNSASHECLRRR